MTEPDHVAGRRTPAKGVHIYSGQPNWVLLTVCTENRERWLAQPDLHKSLHDIWEHTAKAWLVSDYVLLPDHLHLFCAPYDLKFTIERWMGFWKDRLFRRHPGVGKFQVGGQHHRLRSDESYAEKWQYIRSNPVRHGLVKTPEEWPYTGRVHDIRR